MSARAAPRRLRARPLVVIDDPHVSAGTIDRAIGLMSGVGPGDVMATSCTRVGEAKFVPPLYRVGECSACTAPVWLSMEVERSAERHGMALAIYCQHCSGL